MKPYVLWLGSIVDEATLLAGYAVSPAAVRWQSGFIRGLVSNDVAVRNVGHIGEAAWPRGHLRMHAERGAVPAAIDGRLVSYVNVPYGRVASLALGYARAVRRIVRDNGRPLAIVTYNFYPPLVAVALAVAKLTGSRWILISADRDPGIYGRAAGALPDGTMYLSWGEYDASRREHKFHLDGGVPDLSVERSTRRPPRIVYTGALTRGAGIELLADAFERVRNRDVELWICGKGKNAKLDALAARDARVRFKGLVGDDELAEISRSASVFVNPRLPELEENKYNFPSKVLDYLAYGVPIVSTWTDGFAPEYRELLRVADAEPEALARALDDAISMNGEQRAAHATKARTFARDSHSWSAQASRFLAWVTSL